MLKRLLMSVALLCLWPVAAQAEDLGEIIEGKHYQLIQPAVRVADPSKIEVMEFFWHGCVHCYNMEPILQAWKKTLADDVVFRGSPAVWNKPMELHAKAYYTADVLGVLDTMHPALFTAMNVDRKRLSSDAEIQALFVANGVSAEDFQKAYSSFGVGSQARQAASRARAAKITSTPEMMVNGKYRISARLAGSQANMLEVVNFLIEKERGAQ